MKAALFLSSMAVVTAFGGFWPDFSFAYTHGKGNVDPTFMRDDTKKVVIDSKRRILYYDGNLSDKLTYAQAVDYCRNLDAAGIASWHLATKEDMRNILELSRSDITVKHAFRHVLPEIYWSSTSDGERDAWYFDFDLGRYYVADKHKRFRALCAVHEPKRP